MKALAVAVVCGGVAAVASAQPPVTPPKAEPAQTEPAKVEPPKTPETKPETKPESKSESPTKENPKEQMMYVQMKTSMGDIVLELDAAKAPISAENFLKYVDKGFYEGTIFHRVIKGFMIQGGGFTADMKQKSTEAPIKNEWKNGLKNTRGTIAMARTSVPDSATSQFFINVVDNAFLDEPRGGAAYAVFGKVIAGMATVDKIRETPTGVKGGMPDNPVTTVTIEKAKKISADEAKALVAAEKM
jgi:peptidyl-prolyl cis-trans isomerase A (cyclophilin A)